MGWFRSPFSRRPDTLAPAAEDPPPAVPATITGAEWKARGNAALSAGQIVEAAACYEQGVLADPSDASLRLNLGFVLLEQGSFEPAAGSLLQALALRRPTDDFAHEVHYLLGRTYGALGRVPDALQSLEAALAVRPGFVEAVEEGTRLLDQLQRHADAVPWARRLVALQTSPMTRLVLARELALSGGQQEAADLLAAVCAEEPANIEASVQLCDVLFRLGRFAEALAQTERQLAVTGRTADTLVTLAATLGRLGRMDEALAAIEEVRSSDPHRRDALVNHVALLARQGRVEESVACARTGLRLYPDDPDLHWNLAVGLLLLGNFEEGWAEHEWRDGRDRPDRLGAPTDLVQPRWTGESLEGRALFVYGEQGFGDNIQFVRFVPELARRARVVYLQVLKALEPLMTGLPANCVLLPQGAPVPAIDFHCPLMSVPAVLRIDEAHIPARIPYLRADPAEVQAWRERLPTGGLKVGIAWSGKPTHLNDLNRSMSLAVFRKAAVKGCCFVTVQPQLRETDRATLESWPDLLDFGRELRDFSETAALVEALDLVISVDTSVAHLAGALGKPVWVLLPDPPDWRWMLQREDSPWYPSARLYRQGTARSWSEVLERVRAALALLVRS
jgi:tetratricopeptide (TPR) repeat protein